MGTDYVVEIKCPLKAKDSSSFIEAVMNKKVKFNYKNSNNGILCAKCLNII